MLSIIKAVLTQLIQVSYFYQFFVWLACKISSENLCIWLTMVLSSLVITMVIQIVKERRRKMDVIKLKTKEIEKLEKELDCFVYSISHDASAPLKTIRGLAHLISLEDGLGRVYATKVKESAERLEQFILKVYEYLRNARTDINFRNISIPAIVDDIIEKYESYPGFKRLDIQKEFKNIDIVYTDELRLWIILNNLFSNAIKFTKNTRKPKIEIKVYQDGQIIIIEIKDNGEGIPDECKERIFDIFYRASNSCAGSGLGLYIAKESAHKINANLSVRTILGRGSTFALELPTDGINIGRA